MRELVRRLSFQTAAEVEAATHKRRLARGSLFATHQSMQGKGRQPFKHAQLLSVERAITLVAWVGFSDRQQQPQQEAQAGCVYIDGVWTCYCETAAHP